MGTSLGGLCRLSCEADVSSMVRNLQFMLSMVLRARDTTRLVECLLSIQEALGSTPSTTQYAAW